MKEVIGQMASPASGEKDPNGEPKCRGIADVLKSFVFLLERGDNDHLKESVASELQHISEEPEIVDRADGKFLIALLTAQYYAKQSSSSQPGLRVNRVYSTMLITD